MKVVIYLGSLVQLCFREGGTLPKKNTTGVCGECLQCLGHAGWRPLTVCVLSQSTLLRLQFPLQGNCLKWVLGFVHFPGLKPLRFRFSGAPQRHRLNWACILCLSQVQAAQATGCLASTLSPGGQVCLITSLVPPAQFPGCTAGTLSQVCSVSPL